MDLVTVGLKQCLDYTWKTVSVFRLTNNTFCLYESVWRYRNAKPEGRAASSAAHASVGGLSGSPAAGDQPKSHVRIEHKLSLAQISDVAVKMGSLAPSQPSWNSFSGFQWAGKWWKWMIILSVQNSHVPFREQQEVTVRALNALQKLMPGKQRYGSSHMLGRGIFSCSGGKDNPAIICSAADALRCFPSWNSKLNSASLWAEWQLRALPVGPKWTIVAEMGNRQRQGLLQPSGVGRCVINGTWRWN